MLLDQALSLATDRDWMGNPTTKGRFAIYLCGEDQEGALANAEAWCKRHGVDPNDINTRIIFVPMTPDLLNHEDCTLLVRHVRAMLPERVRPVVFIDTWQRSTATGGQNEDKDMQEAIHNAEFIGKELGGPVIAASHPPKSKNTTISGSGVIENSSVAIWQMQPVGKSTTLRQVKVTRIKGTGLGTQIPVVIKTLKIEGHDNYGMPRTGAVLLRDNGTPSLDQKWPEEQDNPLTHNEGSLLCQMRATPGLSFARYADRLNWKPNDSDSRVKNTMRTLAKRGLVTKKEDERYYPTEAGETAAAATCPKLGDTRAQGLLRPHTPRGTLGASTPTPPPR
jgi:hypothetical protein